MQIELSSLVADIQYPVALTLAKIGGKWKCLILYHLSEQGTLRNGKLRSRLPGIFQKVLVAQLREPEHDAIISRDSYSSVPPKVEYQLTALGRTLELIITAMKQWSSFYCESTIR